MENSLINSIHLRFKSIPDNVSLARVVVATVAAQIDFTLSDLDELKVAVSEAVSNAMIHGYAGDPDKMVELIVHRYPDQLVIIIADEGAGITDMDQAMEPAQSPASEHMGLGFVFMRSFVDRLEVDSHPGKGTKVTLIKKLSLRPES